MTLENPRAVAEALRSVDYLPDDRISQVVFLADRLDKPILVEGPAGVGKTELAKSLAKVTGRDLIRLQCYEGLGRGQGPLRVELQEATAEDPGRCRSRLGGHRAGHLLRGLPLTRPLLEAIRSEKPVVLLIDEVDRVEVETEALLLEILSDFQVSMPELGTMEAKPSPSWS